MSANNAVGLIGSITTLLSFVLFIAIVVWAFGKSRREAFDAAALAPFALPDEAHGAEPAARPAEPRS